MGNIKLIGIQCGEDVHDLSHLNITVGIFELLKLRFQLPDGQIVEGDGLGKWVQDLPEPDCVVEARVV